MFESFLGVRVSFLLVGAGRMARNCAATLGVVIENKLASQISIDVSSKLIGSGYLTIMNNTQKLAKMSQKVLVQAVVLIHFD